MPHYDDDNMSQYSQVNVMAAYVSMIRFAMDKLELHLDELGDDILFDGMSSFPDDVLGDDSLFAGYTDPWSPDDDDDEFDEFGAFYTPAQAGCDCDDCRCRNADAKIKLGRMSVGNIMDMLNKTRKDPKPKGYWVD
jgi:hypothetical protein